MGNYNDALMQALARRQRRRRLYRHPHEARKVLVEEGDFHAIRSPKDVKDPVEFNPATVAEYRLIG